MNRCLLIAIAILVTFLVVQLRIGFMESDLKSGDIIRVMGPVEDQGENEIAHPTVNTGMSDVLTKIEALTTTVQTDSAQRQKELLDALTKFQTTQDTIPNQISSNMGGANTDSEDAPVLGDTPITPLSNYTLVGSGYCDVPYTPPGALRLTSTATSDWYTDQSMVVASKEDCGKVCDAYNNAPDSTCTFYSYNSSTSQCFVAWPESGCGGLNTTQSDWETYQRNT